MSNSCPTCGYEAVWILRISTSSLPLCENCLPKFTNKYSHIYSFKLRKEVLHETRQNLHDSPITSVFRTHRKRKGITIRSKEGKQA